MRELAGACVMALVLGGAAHAAVPRGLDACPRLFGHGDHVPPAGFDVHRAVYTVDLRTHQARWHTPVPAALSGIEPLRRRRSVRAAIVQIDERFAGVCTPGRYELRPGDRIGDDVVVLWVLREGMLLEHAGQPAFVAFPNARAPLFRIVWTSSFRLLVPRNDPPPAKAPAAPKRAPPPAKKKR